MDNDQTLSRRTFIAGAAAGMATMSAGSLADVAEAATGKHRKHHHKKHKRPKGPGAPPAVTPSELWQWHQMVADGGPRLTGSAAQANYIEFLARQLELRKFTVLRDHLSFTRWAPQAWSVTVNGNSVPLAFYFPYSGVTPPQGVTAPMAYVGVSPISDWSHAKGKIAVIDVVDAPLPASTLFTDLGRYPANAASPPTLIFEPPISDALVAPVLSAATAAGVLGVICLRSGVSDGLAADQYSPFTTPYYGCPSVWALPSSAPALRTQAIEGQTATLTMSATLTPNSPSDTIYAILPGSDPREAIVINTHTDGPNVPEESGGLGLLAIADHFNRIPQSQRRRTLIFAFVTGHFQLPQFGINGGMASSRWIADHPELLNGTRYKTVAALTVEHLGCREWADNGAHTGYGPTGQNEPGYCYTTTSAMKKIWLQSAAGTANTRTFASLPTGLYFGEGAPFYKEKIATMSLIPGPTYLTAAPKDGSLGKLSLDLIVGQIKTFINAVDTLNTLSASAIGVPAALA